MGKFKQTLLTEDAYVQLKEMKDRISQIEGKKISFTEVIRRTVGKQLVMLKMDADIKNYINAFVDRISSNKHTLGIVLFGSVAKNTYTRFSDIDMAVITDSGFLNYFYYLNKEIKEINYLQEKLMERELSLYISPLIITKKDLKKLNPIYFDILIDGIVLYQKNDTVSDFFNKLSKIKYKRVNTSAGEILIWG